MSWKISFGVVAIIIILSATVVVTLTQFGNFGTAQGQVNSTSSLTPQQKSAICASVGSHVNTTESRICGIPKTPPSVNATSSANMTTGAPSGDLASSSTPSPEG